MASNRREYYKQNRKRIKRELKNTLNGVLSACFGCGGVVLFIASVCRSFGQAGAAGVLLGSLGLLGLLCAAGGVAFGILALREPNIRPALPRLGVITGGICGAVFLILYIMGASVTP